METSGQKESNSKTFRVKSCLVKVISIFLRLWGFSMAIGVLWFAYVFIRSGMINPANILIIGLMTLQCIIVLFIAFRLNKQKWYISLVLLAFIWVVNSLFLGPLINYSTERLVWGGSISMEPTLNSEDYFFVDKLAYRSQSPQRGDIIVFTYPFTGQEMIKRVIGLPGEIISINSGKVFIDGVLLQEPGTISSAERSGQWQVGESEYFVLGDNRDNSSDSRAWGSVPSKNILGKVTYIYFPFSRSGRINGTGYPPQNK